MPPLHIPVLEQATKGDEMSNLWRCQNCFNLTLHEVKNLPKTTTFTCTACGFRVEHTHTQAKETK